MAGSVGYKDKVRNTNKKAAEATRPKRKSARGKLKVAGIETGRHYSHDEGSFVTLTWNRETVERVSSSVRANQSTYATG